MKKRIVTLFLIAALTVTLLAVAAIGAGAEESGHSHCICGAEHASLGNHTAEGVETFTPWDGVSEIEYDESKKAAVYLTADAERTEALVVPAGHSLILCLNGKVLKNTTDGQSVISVSAKDGDLAKANLVLTDCGTAQRYGQRNGDIYTISDAKPTSGDYDTLIGGIITGGKAEKEDNNLHIGTVGNAAGVFIRNGGTID